MQKARKYGKKKHYKHHGTGVFLSDSVLLVVSAGVSQQEGLDFKSTSLSVWRCMHSLCLLGYCSPTCGLVILI